MKKLSLYLPLLTVLFLTQLIGACSTADNRDRLTEQHVLQTRLCNDEACSYTWTLATRLGIAIDHVEDRIGNRNKEYTILGFEFTEDSYRPQVWFPQLYSGERYVIVQIPNQNAHDECMAHYQMAHEATHLIDPRPGRDSTYFQEGLAEYFARELSEDWFQNNNNCLNRLRLLPNQSSVGREYLRALELVDSLLENYPDAFERIKSFRESGGTLNSMTEQQIMELFPNIGALSSSLAASFAS